MNDALPTGARPVSVAPATGGDRLAAESFARLAGACLRATPPGPLDPKSNPGGDHDLDPEALASILATPPRQAAVLVPVVAHADGLTVLLTQRSSRLRVHSGQIAFPGGKIDEGDDGPLGAALREAREEIGLDAATVRPLGYLDSYLSGTGFLVAPVVGLVTPPLALTLNPDEVDDAFEVPLEVLLDPARYELREREWRGRQRRYWAIPVGERTIWGVTAGILRSFRDRFRAP